jgi:hypothetical protein
LLRWVPGTTFSINFESANIVGSGRNITILRVPVTDIDTGQTTLFDVAFKFTFSPDTGLIFEQISSVTPSQPISVANIVPGLYKTQNNACYLLEGPSLLSENRSLYTIRGAGSDASANCRQVDGFTASIISGSATGHPDIGIREVVPNLSETFVYGIVSGSGTFRGAIINNEWQQNEIIGVRQSGDQLIIGLFSEGVDASGIPVDFRDPRESAILTKIIE